MTNFVNLENLKVTVVASSEKVNRFRVPGKVLGLVSDWFGFLSIVALLIDDVLAGSNDDLRSLLSIVINEENLRVSGNSNPVLNRGNLNIIDDLVELPLLNWSLEIRVLPELNLTVLSSGNKVLTVLVDIKSVNWSVMSSD